MAGKSVVSRVYDALDEDIYLRNSIKMGVANLSAISEKIQAEAVPSASKEAVRAAVRRYVSEMEKEESNDALAKLLSNTSFSLKSNISVIQAFQDRRSLASVQDALKAMGLEFNVISSSHAVTLIMGDDNAKEAAKLLGKDHILDHKGGLHAIYLTSGKDIKTVPGFVAYISALFFRKGINIIEFYSCYTDTVLIVSREDSLRAYQLLDKVMGKKKESAHEHHRLH
jgi:hypothetical protein